jgi:hypothetical protein
MGKALDSDKITFPNNNVAIIIQAEEQNDIRHTVEATGLNNTLPVLVVVGGASGVTRYQKQVIDHIMEQVATLAEDIGAAIVDGGTDAGIMASIGQARQKNQLDFPLVGVAVQNLVTWPGQSPADSSGPKRYPLEPNHSHFILVPGEDWGDESLSIAQVGTELARGQMSVTLLVNGGKIAEEDMAHSLDANRPVMVLAGTGRLADELAANPPDNELVRIASTANLGELADQVKSLLAETGSA